MGIDCTNSRSLPSSLLLLKNLSLEITICIYLASLTMLKGDTQDIFFYLTLTLTLGFYNTWSMIIHTFYPLTRPFMHSLSSGTGVHFMFIPDSWWFIPYFPWHDLSCVPYHQVLEFILCLYLTHDNSYLISLDTTFHVFPIIRYWFPFYVYTWFMIIHITELFAHCKGHIFNIHKRAWLGYFICYEREVILGKELISCLSSPNLHVFNENRGIIYTELN